MPGPVPNRNTPFTSGALVSSPPISSLPTLAVGTAYQNTLGYDILLVVFLAVTANTNGTVSLGVGPTNTPAQQAVVAANALTGIWTVPIYLPARYYAKLSTGGTITAAISGQIAMPV